jgi:hypothetical protein
LGCFDHARRGSLCGYISKQNFRIWGGDNPTQIHEKLPAFDVIGPHFLGGIKPDSSVRYCTVLQTFFGREVEAKFEECGV